MHPIAARNATTSLQSETHLWQIRTKNIVLFFVFFVSFCLSVIAQNIAINTTGDPAETGVMLHVKGTKLKATTGFENIFQITSLDADPDEALKLRLGIQTHATAVSRYGLIDVADYTTGTPTYRNLAIQPAGGFVGIGTTAPNGTLEVMDGTANQRVLSVAASATANNLWFVPNLGAAGYSSLSQAGDMGIFFRDDNTIEGGNLVIAPWSASANGIRITSAGNVGIGTTAPGQKLHVSTGYSLLNDVASTVNRNYGPVLWTDKGFGMELGYKTQWGTRIYTRAATENISLGWQTGASTLQSQYTEWMRLINGNVGIGVTAPLNRLHVSIDDAATNANTDVLTLEHTSSAAPAAGFGAGLRFRLDNDSWGGGTHDAGRIQSEWQSIFNGTAQFRFWCMLDGWNGQLEEKLILGGDPGDGLIGAISSQLTFRAIGVDDDGSWDAEDVAAISARLTQGLFNPEASALLFFTRTGGGALTERVRINDAGDLIANTAITLGGVRRTTWPTGSGTGFGTDGGTFAWYNGGNVSFGTTTDQTARLYINAAAVQKALQVTGTSNPEILLQNAGATKLEIGIPTGAGNYITGSAVNDVTIRQTGAQKILFSTSSTGATNDLTLSGGNVGIGNSVPGSKLEITGNLLFTKEAARTISVANSTTANTVGAALTMKAANGVGTANGGALNLQAGAGSGFATDGAVNITTTAGALVGGSINLTLPPSLLAGAINLTSGTSALDTWPGGNVNITAGAATVGNSAGGSINLTAGAGIGTGAAGYVGFLNSHLKSIQTTAPTIAVTTANGITAAAITAGSSDTKGNITTTGTNNGTNTVLTITFNKAYGSAPIVNITPNNSSAQGHSYFVTSTTTTFVLNFKMASATATPSFNYLVIE